MIITMPVKLFSLAQDARKVDRDGAILFEFAPPKPNAIREYDWTKKSSFSLSPTECGEILVMDVSEGKEFFHDPNMGSRDAGLLTKKMKWAPLTDGNGRNILSPFSLIVVLKLYF